MEAGQEPTQPIEKVTPPIEPTPTEPTEPTEPKTFDATYVSELRSEAAKHRKELRATKVELQKLQTAQEAAATAELEAQGQWKTLAEQNAAKTAQLEAQLAEGEKALNAERRNTLTVSIATRLGAINPSDANFQTAVGAIDIAADNNAEMQITQALEALKVSLPYLFGTGRPNLAPFNPSGQPQTDTPLTFQQQRQKYQDKNKSKFFDVTVYKPIGGDDKRGS